MVDPLDKQIEYWNKVASLKTFSHPLDLARFTQYVRRDARILDYGCGYGRICDELCLGGYKNVRGVDLSPKMIERARELFADILFDVVHPSSLPFSDETFDAVILFGVLTCMVSNEGQQQLVRELSRVLRPGGILYLGDFPIQEDERNRDRYQRYRGMFENYGTFETEDGAVLRHHTLEHIEFLLHGFRRHELFFVDLLTMNGNPARGFQYIGEKDVNS